MNINYKLILFCFLFLLSCAVVSACISLPIVEMKKTGSEFDANCSKFKVNRYSFQDGEMLDNSEFLHILDREKLLCNLTDEDVSILLNFSRQGYDIKEQTDQEYEKFKRMTKRNNFWFLDKYPSVEREGRWTGYIKKETSLFRSRSLASSKC